MKKLVLLLCAAMAVSAAAQTGASEHAKPSAATLRTHSDTPHAAAANAPLVAQPAVTQNAIPPGTAVYMKLETPLSTFGNKAGDRFAGRVTQPVVLNGKTVIPVGAALEGRVISASEPRRIRGNPTIDLHPDTITMPDGTRMAISAVVVDTSLHPQVEVNDEGQIKGKGRDGRDWKEAGVGTGAGAVIGGLAGGGKGMLIGAGVGATASVVRWLTRTHSAYLPAGTEIVMEISRPMTLSSRSSGQ